MDYKIVFCDIDGTIINSRFVVSGATKRKVAELADKGIPFVLVSARSPLGIDPIMNQLGVREPMVAFSGGLILDSDGRVLKSEGITFLKALKLKADLNADWPDVSVSCFSDNDWLVDRIDHWIAVEGEITSTTPVVKPLGELAKDRAVHKLLCMGEPERISEMNRIVAESYPELSVLPSKDTYLEIMSNRAIKSRAVEFICQRYGVPIKNAVSFGDNYNDIDMLKATGTSFAMGNAPEAVKSAATYVTADNDSDGVVAGLVKIGL